MRDNEDPSIVGHGQVLYTIGKIIRRPFMKLIFDISVLGYGTTQPAFRTGVFRATEELAFALIQEMNDEIIFCAGDSIRAWALAYSFWKHNLLNEKPFAPAASFADLYVSTVNQLNRLNQIKKPNLPTKLFRRLLREITQLSEPKTKDLFPSLLDGIYHSPFYPLEPSTQRFKRVLSIYDLINLTHREVSEGPNDFLKRIVSSVSNEDHVICSSSWTAQELLEYKKTIHSRQVHVIPLGVKSHFLPASKDSINYVKRLYGLNHPYFLGLSTLEKRKNFPFLIKTFQNFLQSYPKAEVDLVLAGAPGNAAKMIQDTIQVEFQKRIKLIGFVSEDHLPALYTGALAFVFPSLYEGFGFPPLEAMACGCPVVSSRGSSLDEVVGEGGNRLDPQSEADWTHAFIKIYDSISEQENWRQKGLDWVKRFSWKETARKHCELYKTISN